MPRYRRPGVKRTSTGSCGVRGYTLQGRNGRVNYVGVTNSPSCRAGEHKQDGKRGSMRVETQPMSRPAARKWEADRLAAYRRNHGGNNPRHNQTRSGGWNG